MTRGSGNFGARAAKEALAESGPVAEGMVAVGAVGPGGPILRSLVKNGMTLKQIGKQYGVSEVAVHKWLKNSGITPAGRTTIDVNPALKLLDKGYTMAETAKELGMGSKHSLGMLLRDRGLTNLSASEWKELMRSIK